MAGLTIKTTFAAINKLTQPITTMQGQVNKFASSARKATDGIGASFNRLKGLIAMALGGLSIGMAIKGITEFAEKGDEIERMAKVIGMSATSLQELRFAAKMADVSTGDFDTALKKMNMNLGQLRGKQGTLYTALAKTNPRLAIQLKTAKDSDSAFTLLADAIAKQPDPAKRAALAVAAFGRAGQNLIPMMLEGSAGLEKFREEARKSGLVMGDDATKAASSLADSIKRLKMQGQSLLNTVLSRIIQKIAPLVDRLLAWAQANRELIGQRIGEIIDKIADAVTKTYNIVTKLNDMMGGHLLRNLIAVVAVWKTIRLAIAAATVAQAAYNLVSKKGGVPGVPGLGNGIGINGPSAIKWGVAGAGAAGIGTALAVGGIAAGAVLGTAALGQAYAKWQNSMITDPNQIAGGNRALMSSKQMSEYDRQRAAQHVIIDFKNMPAGVQVSSSGQAGAPAATLNRGNAVRDSWH